MQYEKHSPVTPRTTLLIVLLGIVSTFATGQNLHAASLKTAPPLIPAPNFQTSDYLTGLDPNVVVTGDFNHDGKLDLVTANFHDGTVGVLLGKGDGTFKPVSFYSTGPFPISVAVGDFNGDGKEDLAVADSELGSENTTASVVVLLGNGDGTFGSPVEVASFNQNGLNEITTLVTGDFRGDGKLDLAVALGYDFNSPGEVAVLLGNGDGTFESPFTYALSGYPLSIAVADLRGDGKLDMAVATQIYKNNGQNFAGYISVLLGNGDGTFQTPIDNELEAYPSGAAVGDFNGDGKLDLAAAIPCGTDNTCSDQFGPSQVAVLLGQGGGSFNAPIYYDGSFGDYSVAIADFNGDGCPDLVTDFTGWSLGISGTLVYLNACDKTGNLETPVEYTVKNAVPWAVGVGSFGGQVAGSSDVFFVDQAGQNGNATDVLVMQNLSATRIALKSSPNPSQQGQSVTFTATVTAAVKGSPTPTGTVKFKAKGSPKSVVVKLVNGVATFTYSKLPAGKIQITGEYSGDSTFNPGVQTLIQTVN